MSEVKPTLVKGVLKETDIPNSWKTNFSNWLWDNAKGRGYTWIMSTFSTIFIKSYEYRLSFEKRVEKFGFTFPFVVKTNSNDVKEVFIYGTGYKTRSGVNYGTSFIVSGLEFHFKLATRYKLEGDVFNTFKIFYILPNVQNRSVLECAIPTLYYVKPYLYNKNTFWASIIYTHFLFSELNHRLKVSLNLQTFRIPNSIFTNKLFLGFGFEVIRNLNLALINTSIVKSNLEVIKGINSNYLNKNILFIKPLSETYIVINFREASYFLFGLKAVRNTKADILNRNFMHLSLLRQQDIASSILNRNFMHLSLLRQQNIASSILNRNLMHFSLLGQQNIVSSVVNKNKIDVELERRINSHRINSEFIALQKFDCYCVNSKPSSGSFVSREVFNVYAIANCNNTTWNRFGGVWAGCEYWVGTL